MIKNWNKLLVFTCVFLSLFFKIDAQKSVARMWNEVLLNAISIDRARPPIHARNLFHTSVLMYDSWAVYDPVATTFFLGQEIDGFNIPFEGITSPEDRKTATETTLSYACYRLLKHRFQNSPGKTATFASIDSLMTVLGYDVNFIDDDYKLGNHAALGIYMANQMITFGFQDGSNEINDYKNTFYKPVNVGLDASKNGDPTITNPNRWQPLVFDVFVDQSGNISKSTVPEFQSPEWGYVSPFSLKESDKTWKSRDGHDFPVYLDPGAPKLIDSLGIEDDYKWNFLLVSMWGSHLHPSDGVKWDISPASLGNLNTDLTHLSNIRDFYRDTIGGDNSKGYALNPITGLPYTPQIVYRGDYARVLAEFWADGPKSTTPPGHWFKILNYVSDQPSFEHKYKGQGDVLDKLEWDVKSYITMGGAMHDCAVAAWGVKGYYDYVRPISAIRYMVGQGQSSDKNLPHYSPHGIPLVDGFSELVKEGDPLVGKNNSNLNKIKLYTWKGPRYISNPLNDDAGIGWILGEDWYPYQRPTFITPPFAGYVSGHSTFSRAAANVMTQITGSPYFPRGMGEFVATKNEFLVFEDGPSETITLQWASYQDASDQTSLSRIWGGIHPPEDDIPGRIMGDKIAQKAVKLVDTYFEGSAVSTIDKKIDAAVFPNPIKSNDFVSVQLNKNDLVKSINILDINGRPFAINDYRQMETQIYFNTPRLIKGAYVVKIETDLDVSKYRVLVIEN